MVFLRSVTSNGPEPVVHGEHVLLRIPVMSDFLAWSGLRGASMDLLKPREPHWADDELTKGAFRRRLNHYHREMRDGRGYAFLIIRKSDHQLLGGISLGNVTRGVTQSASLGYWIGAPYTGQGYMSQSVRAIIPFVFDVLNLHRLEAACLPDNTASMRVLERNSFRREGLARSYLKINNMWQDHIVYALLEEDILI